MLKVNVYSENGLAKWDNTMIKVSRVPCIGEYVRVNANTPAMRVIRVVHNVEDDTETVGGLTLADI